MNLSIDFTSYTSQLSIRRKDKKRYIFAFLRKKWLVLLPEEFVRQLLIVHLLQTENYPKNRMRSEMALEVNGLKKRCDLIVFTTDMKPFLLVECKAAHIPITQETFDQIARYNLTLDVPYLLVTNGIDTYCCLMDKENESYTFLDGIPSF